MKNFIFIRDYSARPLIGGTERLFRKGEIVEGTVVDQTAVDRGKWLEVTTNGTRFKIGLPYTTRGRGIRGGISRTADSPLQPYTAPKPRIRAIQEPTQQTMPSQKEREVAPAEEVEVAPAEEEEEVTPTEEEGGINLITVGLWVLGAIVVGFLVYLVLKK